MKRLRKLIKITVVILIIFLLLIFFIPSRTPKIERNNSVASIQKEKTGGIDQYTKTWLEGAIFERNGEICYFNYSNDEIKILSGGGKYAPEISPDMTKILYRRSVLETEGNTMIFGIIDINGNPVREIIIDTELSNNILNCQWFSSDTVGITTHVNPVTSELFVYDINSGEKKGYYVGYSFAQIPGTEKVIYAKNVPYWSDESVYHSFIADGRTVYTSDILDARLSQPLFSEDLTKIAFIENLPGTNKENEAQQRIIVADFNIYDMVLQNTQIIEVPAETYGYLSFDDNNDICIVYDNLVLKYDENMSSFLRAETSQPSNHAAKDMERFAKLQTAVTKHWGDDSLDEINSITWVYESSK